jgi:hypothetical protein
VPHVQIKKNCLRRSSKNNQLIVNQKLFKNLIEKLKMNTIVRKKKKKQFYTYEYNENFDEKLIKKN